ncbi:ABC transporter substrate-binding protein [Streptomyces violaceusniger]|uniref:ABC transporter substrate-binding protein n=1 Tax=Streptomyces violaceusniger TaxID=68280 RepID=UPI0009961CB6|nr:iron-siderophore ABC transporter substrate-binding protein [Streptomyces hygroscopicus]AQW48005.1 iron ABC transporter [Streptomyces hygroscopicus]
MRPHRLFPLLSAALAVTVLTGCGSSDAASSSTSSKAPESRAADGAFPRTVAHAQGGTPLKAEPKRIAAISTGQLDDLLTLGVVPVATTRADYAGLVPTYLRTAFPRQAKALGAMADIGTRASPNMEKLAAAKPDLILVNSTQGNLYATLSAIAPTVVTKGRGVNWKKDLLTVADAVGRRERARTLLTRFEKEAADQGEKLGGEHTELSMVRFNPDRVRMFGKKSFTGTIADDMGLGRPKSQRFDDISQDLSGERIPQMDGDWIFYSVQGRPGKTDAATYLSNPLWKKLGAVRAGHTVKVDDDPWYLNAGPTAARVVLRDITERLGH